MRATVGCGKYVYGVEVPNQRHTDGTQEMHGSPHPARMPRTAAFLPRVRSTGNKPYSSGVGKNPVQRIGFKHITNLESQKVSGRHARHHSQSLHLERPSRSFFIFDNAASSVGKLPPFKNPSRRPRLCNVGTLISLTLHLTRVATLRARLVG